jgi:hypothetical protein
MALGSRMRVAKAEGQAAVRDEAVGRIAVRATSTGDEDADPHRRSAARIDGRKRRALAELKATADLLDACQSQALAGRLEAGREGLSPARLSAQGGINIGKRKS